MHKTYKWKLRGFFWLFNLILQLDNFIKSYLTFSFCRSTFDGSSGSKSANATNNNKHFQPILSIYTAKRSLEV